MKTEQVKLSGSVQYNTSYPPQNAKKGYVAKIIGRASGPMKYEREFLGKEADIFEGDEGLYERQRGDKKGGCTRWYHVVLSHPEHGLIVSNDCENEAPRIAKLLSEGHDIHDIVTYSELTPSQKVEGRMEFGVIVRSPAAAKKAAQSATVDIAVEACWDVMKSLSTSEAKKVMTLLRKRIAEIDEKR